MVCSLHSVTTGSRDRANVSLIIIIQSQKRVTKFNGWHIHICVVARDTAGYAMPSGDPHCPHLGCESVDINTLISTCMWSRI